jgi:mono/diheme cytochrome c family protein
VLFHQACGACHTLSGHNDRFHQGGDLLGFHSSHRQLLELAREMPVPHALTARELGTIVTYVRAVERSHAGP